MNNFTDKVSFIWGVAGLLRGPYKPAQYGDVMLPLWCCAEGGAQI